jgi:hypothetical protein
MNELNPQIQEKLKVFLVSPNLLTGLICFNKTIIGTHKEEILKTILDEIHKNKYGKELLNLFSIDRLVPFEESHLTSLSKIMNNNKRTNEK